MVLYFTCSVPGFVVYMGKNKFENEQLLAYGFPEDLWFHVDKHSSAHVYLRIPIDRWRKMLSLIYPPNGVPPKGGLGQLTEEQYRIFLRTVVYVSNLS